MSLLKTSEWKEEIQKFLSGGPSPKDFMIVLDRIAIALEVMAGLRPITGPGKDESEVMESDDRVYAQQEIDDLTKGRPEEED